jgi:hypothetical protein
VSLIAEFIASHDPQRFAICLMHDLLVKRSIALFLYVQVESDLVVQVLIDVIFRGHHMPLFSIM